jgi:Flp pilus assembly protein TadG
MSRHREQGQVLVLFAGALVVLVGVAALAVDVALVYSLQRYERTVADSAALAGAQDLVTKNTRANPTPSQQRDARRDALELAARTLGGSAAPTCNPNNDIVNCPITGTQYSVSVRTPSPSAMDVNPLRAVQVTVRQADVPLTFARLLGQHDWNVAITSVAGIGFGSRYALITLRPPAPSRNNNSDNNQDDISVNGGTVVTITGDIGSNTNAVIAGQSASGQNSRIVFPSNTDYRLDHYDWYEAWTEPPIGHPILSLIPDPGYPFPSRTNVQPGGQDTANCQAAINAAIAAGYKGHSSSSDSTQTYALTTSNTTCWKPGSYSYDIGDSQHGKSGNSTTILLEPGVYFLDAGLGITGTLIGGYTPGSYDSATGVPNDHTGVALIFPEALNLNNGAFAGNNATLVALNGGSCVDAGNPGNCKSIATPAVAPDGTALQVTFKSPSEGDVVVPETLLVKKDAACAVQPPPYPAACDDQHNKTINLPGGGSLFLAGVQYAPSDHVFIGGGSSGSGFLGQIVAWTVKYDGGSQIGEIYPGNVGNGTLRLDAACTGPNTICINP